MFEQEAICKKDKCCIQTSMKEEDKVGEEEADLAKADTTKSNPENTTSITDKMSRTREAEHPEGGGAIRPDPTDKTIPPNADIVVNSATLTQSVKRRRVSQPPQPENSENMPPMPTTTIVARCL